MELASNLEHDRLQKACDLALKYARARVTVIIEGQPSQVSQIAEFVRTGLGLTMKIQVFGPMLTAEAMVEECVAEASRDGLLVVHHVSGLRNTLQQHLVASLESHGLECPRIILGLGAAAQDERSRALIPTLADGAILVTVAPEPMPPLPPPEPEPDEGRKAHEKAIRKLRELRDAMNEHPQARSARTKSGAVGQGRGSSDELAKMGVAISEDLDQLVARCPSLYTLMIAPASPNVLITVLGWLSPASARPTRRPGPKSAEHRRIIQLLLSGLRHRTATEALFSSRLAEYTRILQPSPDAARRGLDALADRREGDS